MKRTAKIFLLIGTLSFAALYVSSPLLHNHEIDFNNHTNCPAFILNITFATFVFTFLTKIILSFPLNGINFLTEIKKNPCGTSFQTFNNRAPPISAV